jgi:hypothetical protein
MTFDTCIGGHSVYNYGYGEQKNEPMAERPRGF